MPSLGPEWMDPNYLLAQFGDQFFWVSVAIIFIECGLLFPILPGDSLLFAMGLFISNGSVHVNLGVALVILCVAAFAGNVAGYEIGRAVGGPLYERDGRIVKRQYFDQTHAFFARHGNKALVIGRFVPVVRTYITVVAGMGRMERKRFFTWSFVGAVLWACSVTLLGYFLGRSFPALADNLELAIVAVVVLSLVPAVVEWLRHRRQSTAMAREAAEAADDLTDDTGAHRDH
ncbi:MAG TPA: VTT domain-containing protein [Segeticoccus sp.]|nr:VTT domain-containing protein [Segeticoccus sp.]